MSKPIIRYIELYGGGCGLRAESPASIYRSEGTSNVRLVRNATEKDIVYVKAMGGHVPDGRIAKDQP